MTGPYEINEHVTPPVYLVGRKDDAPGWRPIKLPLSAFTTPGKKLTLSAIWGYSLLPPTNSSGTFYMDKLRLGTR